MSPPLQILQITDSKPGHENQSRGLIDALERLTPVAVERRDVSRSRLARWLDPPAHRPDLIVGAGHRTHLALLWWSRRFDAPAVVLMKPSLPFALFDACIVPEHDLGKLTPPAHVIPSKGALNRVPPPDPAEKSGGLILLGGPSASHGWDQAALTHAIRHLLATRPDQPWQLTDSRRTPRSLLPHLAKACPSLGIYAHDTTHSDWLPQALARAAEVWVTADSISMIYESLSSGARVGLLPTPVTRPGRVTRGVAALIAGGWVTRFEDGAQTLAAPTRVLREADRCAAILLSQIFPNRLHCRLSEAPDSA